MPLLIVGASVRAAAHSALRAGLTPVAVDLFADRDLIQVAQVLRVERWPRDVPTAVRDAPPGPWMYTGALENHPRIVAAVSAERPLWGNPAAVLRSVRDPFRVQAALAAAGLPALDVRRAGNSPPADGSWLLKPLRGAAGRGIRPWIAGVPAGALREPHYFQRCLAGASLSAVFAGAESARLAGVSQQLIGTPALGGKPFAYCGSIGPLDLETAVADQIERTGIELGRRFGLRGLFGVDFVLTDGVAWPVEVNPRYTASVEVLENAWGLPLLDWHRRACEVEPDPNPVDQPGRPQTVAKAILYAPEDLEVPSLAAFVSGDPIGSMPAYADLPNDGERVSRGRPLCTVLASGTTPEECVTVLNDRLARLRETLGLPRGSCDLNAIVEPTRESLRTPQD